MLSNVSLERACVGGGFRGSGYATAICPAVTCDWTSAFCAELTLAFPGSGACAPMVRRRALVIGAVVTVFSGKHRRRLVGGEQTKIDQ